MAAGPGSDRGSRVSGAAKGVWNVPPSQQIRGEAIFASRLRDARRLFDVKVEGFWVLVGCGFFAAGYWELWNVGIPLAPVVLIVAGVGLLVWQFLGRSKRG